MRGQPVCLFSFMMQNVSYRSAGCAIEGLLALDVDSGAIGRLELDVEGACRKLC